MAGFIFAKPSFWGCTILGPTTPMPTPHHAPLRPVPNWGLLLRRQGQRVTLHPRSDGPHRLPPLHPQVSPILTPFTVFWCLLPISYIVARSKIIKSQVNVLNSHIYSLALIQLYEQTPNNHHKLVPLKTMRAIRNLVLIAQSCSSFLVHILGHTPKYL